MSDHQPKYAGKIIGGVIIAVIVILAWSLLKEKDEIIDLVDQGAADTQIDADEVIDARTYEYANPEAWKFYDNAMEDIQSLDSDQSISFGIVRNPIKENVVYFASNKFDQDKEEVLVSVYEYNESDYTFSRIFKKTYAVGEIRVLSEKAVPTFRVIGYENGELIILVQELDDSPGRCAHPIMLGVDNSTSEGDRIRMLVSIDLSDLASGIKSYSPSPEALAVGEDFETTCLNEVD